MITNKKDSQQQTFDRYQALVKHIIHGLIGEEVEVKVTVGERGGRVNVDIDIPPEYRGQVIGKGGRTARAIRTLIEVAPFDSPYPTLVNIVD